MNGSRHSPDYSTEGKYKKIGFIAGGTGITPFY